MQRFTPAVKREALRLDRIKNADLSGRLNHRGWGVGSFVNASVAVCQIMSLFLLSLYSGQPPLER